MTDAPWPVDDAAYEAEPHWDTPKGYPMPRVRVLDAIATVAAIVACCVALVWRAWG